MVGRVKGWANPSPPFTLFIFGWTPFVGNGLVFIEDQLQASLMTGLRDEFREKVKAGEGWVKGQLNPSPLETPVFIGVSDDLVKGEG